MNKEYDCYILTGATGAIFIPIKDRFVVNKKKYCKRITKKQASRMLSSFNKFICDNNVSFVFKKEIHPYYGICSYRNIVNEVWVVLNPRRPMVPTAVHELLHALYSEACENEILAMEYQLMLLLSDIQLQNFIFHVSGRLLCRWKNFNVFEELGSVKKIKKAQEKTKDMIKYTGEGTKIGVC